MEDDSFSDLPEELIQKIANEFFPDFTPISSLCRTSKRFREIICNDLIFWNAWAKRDGFLNSGESLEVDTPMQSYIREWKYHGNTIFKGGEKHLHINIYARGSKYDTEGALVRAGYMRDINLINYFLELRDQAYQGRMFTRLDEDSFYIEPIIQGIARSGDVDFLKMMLKEMTDETSEVFVQRMYGYEFEYIGTETSLLNAFSNDHMAMVYFLLDKYYIDFYRLFSLYMINDPDPKLENIESLIDFYQPTSDQFLNTINNVESNGNEFLLEGSVLVPYSFKPYYEVFLSSHYLDYDDMREFISYIITDNNNQDILEVFLKNPRTTEEVIDELVTIGVWNDNWTNFPEGNENLKIFLQDERIKRETVQTQLDYLKEDWNEYPDSEYIKLLETWLEEH